MEGLNADQRAGVPIAGKVSYTIDQAAVQLDRAGVFWTGALGQAAQVTYAQRAGAPAQMPDDTAGFARFTSTRIDATALYHTLLAPSVAGDADGRYRGPDNQVHRADGFAFRSTFSLWDTFRALIEPPAVTADIVRSLVASREDSPSGILPVWQFQGPNAESRQTEIHPIPDVHQTSPLVPRNRRSLEAARTGVTPPARRGRVAIAGCADHW